MYSNLILTSTGIAVYHLNIPTKIDFSSPIKALKTMFHLPFELKEEIVSYLPYPDIISFGLTSWENTFFLEEYYWQRKLITDFPNYKEDSSWLTSKGKYVQAITLSGDIVPGSENFISILDCLQKSYNQKNDKLLSYFTRLVCKAKYLYPIIGNHKKAYNPYLRLQEILKMCIIDSREESFLITFRELDPLGVGKDILLDPKIVVPFYFLAKRKKLERVKQELMTCFPPLWGTFGEYLDYCVHSMDAEMFKDMAPYADYYDKNRLRSILDIYPWLEGDEIYKTIGYRNPGFTPVPDIPKIIDGTLKSGFTTFYSSVKGFTRLLISGERQKIREELLKEDINKQTLTNIQSNIYCTHTSRQDLYNFIFRFTVPSLGKADKPPLILDEILTTRIVMGCGLDFIRT